MLRAVTGEDNNAIEIFIELTEGTLKTRFNNRSSFKYLKLSVQPYLIHTFFFIRIVLFSQILVILKILTF